MMHTKVVEGASRVQNMRARVPPCATTRDGVSAEFVTMRRLRVWRVLMQFNICAERHV